jgi:uncharacterized protein
MTLRAPLTAFHQPFGIDEALGRVAHEPDYARHVEQMMRAVLMTAPGERINRPDFGCGIKRMVFAPNGAATAALAQVTVFEALNRWLAPVIRVDDVKVESRVEMLVIRVAYTLKARQERRYLNLELAP